MTIAEGVKANAIKGQALARWRSGRREGDERDVNAINAALSYAHAISLVMRCRLPGRAGEDGGAKKGARGGVVVPCASRIGVWLRFA